MDSCDDNCAVKTLEVPRSPTVAPQVLKAICFELREKGGLLSLDAMGYFKQEATRGSWHRY